MREGLKSKSKKVSVYRNNIAQILREVQNKMAQYLTCPFNNISLSACKLHTHEPI
jgi:hypothetical protein